MKRSATIHGAGITPADAIAAALEYRDLIHPDWEIVADMEVAPITSNVGRWFHARATVVGEVA